MKIRSLLSFLLFVLVVHSAFAQMRSNKDLIGRWSASNVQIEFFPDGRVMLTMRGGSLPVSRYHTDFTRTPAELTIEMLQQPKRITYRSTIEFVNNNSLRLTTLDDDLARAFDKKRSVILARKP